MGSILWIAYCQVKHNGRGKNCNVRSQYG